MTFTFTNFVAHPTATTATLPAPTGDAASIKRRCDSLEDDSSLYSSYSEESCNAPKKRMKSSHHHHQPAQGYAGQHQQPQEYREPIQFVTSSSTAFFTYGGHGQGSSNPFQRQP